MFQYNNMAAVMSRESDLYTITFLNEPNYDLLPFFLVPDSAPSNVNARNLSSTELLVQWDPLAEKFIHGVLVAYSINITRDGLNFTKINDISPLATSYRITDLRKYTRYVISVAAINEVGEGISSDHVIVWTDEDGKYHVSLCCWLQVLQIRPLMQINS